MNRAAHRRSYRHRLDRVIEHIERNPEDDLSLAALAGIAHFSPFHFHRVFRAHTGRTVQSFVAQSRLNRALTLMRSSPRKRLAQVAAECGFETGSSFSKAFRKAFGTSPSGADLKSLVCRDIPQQPTPSPEPKIGRRRWRVAVQPREAMDLAYVRVTGGYLRPQTLVDGYQDLEAWISAMRLDRSQSLLIGMSMDDPDIVPLDACRYDFCCTVPSSTRPTAVISRTTLPAANWATVRCVGGLADVESAWTYLFRDWLPASGWQAAALPAIEIFRKRPEEIGWDRFDLECCLPVTALTIG